MESTDYDETDTKTTSNWSVDYWENLDPSEHAFPNIIWHVKPAREMAIKSTLMVIVGVLGIFLNSIILIILMKNKWLWSASNYLVANLAFTDLMTLLFCPWFMLVRDFYQQYVLKNFGCRFEGFLQASFLLSSVNAVILVSYDRLAAAALTAEARVTVKAAPKLIIVSWFVACAMALPWAIKRTYQERQWLDYLESFCVEDVQVMGIYWHFLLTLLVWVPLGLMCITYGTIMWRLEWSARELRSRGGGTSVAKARNRAMRITACVLLVAVACRVPYTALIYWMNNLENDIDAVKGGFEIMWFAANFLIYLNCAVNPLIYGFTNIRLRKAMDRTPGVAWFRFGSWCCVCSLFKRKKLQMFDKNTEKIFVIENSPRPNMKLSRAIKHILHINKESVEFSIKVDDVTTKPTKVTPVKTEHA
ncbi:ultraviolet-sensitive opsin [Anticarsia gemmatalis]|uniref:ultraviolet-sensitive opsin n=1 Tax=Anticarsia gemmatalis TaxID=129554 RepID=UPI003F7666C2